MIQFTKIDNDRKNRFLKNEFKEYWDELRVCANDTPKVYCLMEVVWEDPDYFPCWIEEDGKKKGFAFFSYDEKKGLCIEQFCVFEKYRRTGVATRAVKRLLSKDFSNVTFRINLNNPNAVGFWDSVNNNVDKNFLDEVNKTKKCRDIGKNLSDVTFSAKKQYAELNSAKVFCKL